MDKVIKDYHNESMLDLRWNVQVSSMAKSNHLPQQGEYIDDVCCYTILRMYFIPPSLWKEMCEHFLGPFSLRLGTDSRISHTLS